MQTCMHQFPCRISVLITAGLLHPYPLCVGTIWFYHVIISHFWMLFVLMSNILGVKYDNQPPCGQTCSDQATFYGYIYGNQYFLEGFRLWLATLQGYMMQWSVTYMLSSITFEGICSIQEMQIVKWIWHWWAILIQR